MRGKFSTFWLLWSFNPTESKKKNQGSLTNEVVIWCLISSAIALILSYISYSIIKGRSNRWRGFRFFHPYTNDGVDGERVLWHTVKAIQKESSDLDCLIYTDDHDASSNSLMARVVRHFGGVFKVRVEKQVWACWERDSKRWEDFLEKRSHTKGCPLSIWENDEQNF